MSQQYPSRRFRPLQESVAIVEKMLAIAAYYPTETITNPDGTKMTVVEYWEKRLHGYLKLANQKGLRIRSSLRDESDKEQ
jgi:hypothetical protein